MTAANDRALLGVCATLTAASAGLTVVWCMSMTAMAGMPMPGGWTMSMIWMRMPGQRWLDAGASFLIMWMVMMVAMMLPSLVPMLRRYRHAVSSTGTARLGRLTVLMGVAYFVVWLVLGLIAFPIGVTLAAEEMRNPALARAVPASIGAIVIIVGALQFTPWKAHHLACCRATPVRRGAMSADLGNAVRHGIDLGLHCGQCCGGLIATLLVVGVMDLRAMLAVGIAITLERLAPAGDRIARAIGAVTICVGLFLMARVFRSLT